MTKRLIISERQLGIITNHIGAVNEGFSDLTLGMLLLMGVELTGQNEAIAQRAVKDPNIIKQVDNILADTDKLTQFIDKVEGVIPNIRQLVSSKVGDIEETLDGESK